ncbi:MAG: tetratricopeptide repeat protein [Rhodospirillaceae bacterium]|nr:tetratricopeptide repeat protein [Rhodospirillaceae bacterium]
MNNPSAPDLAAQFRQAFARHQAGDLNGAAALYGQILTAQPRHFDALHLLGVLRLQTGDAAGAAGLIRQALAVDGAQVAALSNLAAALNALNDHVGALTSLDRALALTPDNAEVHYNRAVTLRHLKHEDEALDGFTRALAVAPAHLSARIGRGALLRDLGRPHDALTDLDAALTAAPTHAVAHYNRSQALKDLNDATRAETAFRAATQSAPDFAEAHVGLAEMLLLTGQDAEGWREYEWRWRTAGLSGAARSFAQMQWTGAQSLRGKTILIHAEQGFGDSLQVCRLVPAVERLGAKVVLEAPKPLQRLLSTVAGVSAVIAAGEPLPPFDLHCPLLSLPLALNAPRTFPGPYLHVDAALAETWRAQVSAWPHPRVGLAWAGRPTHRNDRNRSLGFHHLTPVLRQAGTFVSVQKDMSADDRAALHASPQVMDAGANLSDFADTAALVSQLNLVIAVDTAVAHLAGALGKPVWIMLPFAPDWRWGLNQAETPWYPSARLYRQPAPGDWASVIARIADDLTQFTR